MSTYDELDTPVLFRQLVDLVASLDKRARYAVDLLENIRDEVAAINDPVVVDMEAVGRKKNP